MKHCKECPDPEGCCHTGCDIEYRKSKGSAAPDCFDWRHGENGKCRGCKGLGVYDVLFNGTMTKKKCPLCGGAGNPPPHPNRNTQKSTQANGGQRP